MKKLFIVLFSMALAATASAQGKMAVCKHCPTNVKLGTYHLYNRSKIEHVNLEAGDQLVVYTDGDRHSYDKAHIDSIVFSRPYGYNNIGYAPYKDYFVNETFSSSLGAFETGTTKGAPWEYSAGYQCAIATGYKNGTTTPSESYMFTPEFDFTNTTAARLEFDYKMNYSGSTAKVLMTDCFTGNPATTEWTALIEEVDNPNSFDVTKHVSLDIPSRFIGESNVVLAFYHSCGNNSSTWEVFNVKMKDLTADEGGEEPGNPDEPGNPGGDDPTNKNRNDVSKSTNKEVWRLEFPKIVGDDMNLVITHRTANYGITYSLEWDCKKKANRWTCYQMHKGNSESNVKRDDDFKEDPNIPSKYRTTLADYKGSGYSRGHLCPSSDRLCSKEQNHQTFYLSNMQPQIQDHNGGVWNQLEIRLRDQWNIDSKRDTLYVIKAATIDDNNIKTHTSSGLIVPKYFYMAILSVKNGVYRALGVWSPHAGGSKTEFITIDELEKRTGIDFFCNLPDETEDKVEATYDSSYWGKP